MAYGTIKADTFIYDSSGDQTLSLANLVQSTGATFTGNIVLNAQTDVRFADADSSNYVGFQAPSSVSSNLLYTLPGADGNAGEQLTTDGSGTLSWSAAVNVAAASLTGNTLASGVTASSLTSVGTLGATTFNGDVTFTGASSNGLWDKSANAFVANLTGDVTGDLTGNVTGNCSGTAATVTGATQSNITALGTLAGLTSSSHVTLNSASELRLADSDSSNYLAFKAPGTVSSNITYTYPAADGTSGYVLSTDGSGALSWVDRSVDLSANRTFTGTQTFNGASNKLSAVFKNTAEVCVTTSTAATGTINYDTTNQSVRFSKSNATGNFVLNFRGSSGTTMNNILPASDMSLTVAFLVQQGGTAYYCTSVEIDGTTSQVTTEWQGGSAPSSGNANSIDVYTFTIIKTASATYTVLAAQTQFA
tara:strand:- start:600 stop:1859 length:1260 start_codon:yes stop_codon:yes gene_type:complete